MNTAGFLTNYIILSLHVVWTISPNTVWSSVQIYKYSILFTSSTSVIIHTCIHVHQIKLVNCSTLCNLVLWWMYSHVARLKILFFVFVLCSWNDPKGKRIWGLVSICSLLFFFTIYFVLVYKSKKVFYYWTNVSRAELLQACVCVICKVWVAKLFAHTHTCANTFLDISSYPTTWKVFLNDTLFLSCTYITS